MIYYYWKIFIYFLIFYNSIINCERDFYQILGVKRDATLQDIKKAYRNLALKYHPDKSEDPDAEKKFIEVGNAYAILSDPEKRKLYDQFGEAGVNPQASQKQGGFSGTNFKTGTFNFHFGASDAFKIFEQFFGSKDGGFPGGGFASSNFPGGSFSNGRFPGGSFSNGGFPGGGFSSSNFQGKKPPNVRQNSQQKTPQEIYSRNKDINFFKFKKF
jgi:DnaJ-class molecular chaperone